MSSVWVFDNRVTADTVSYFLREGETRIKSAANGNLTVDLSKVTVCDSAGVALCLALLRMARGVNKQIVFSNPPTRMMDMIRVSGVDAILPLKGACA
jgi:anti-anti-sigma factor